MAKDDEELGTYIDVPGKSGVRESRAYRIVCSIPQDAGPGDSWIYVGLKKKKDRELK
jgi:hypothetical protein